MFAEIIRSAALPFINSLSVESANWYQDNHPVHRASAQYLSTFDLIDLIRPPPYSPDLNPIENIWAEMKKHLCGRVYSSKDELFAALQDKWVMIADNGEYLNSLVFSMGSRLRHVINKGGSYTRY